MAVRAKRWNGKARGQRIVNVEVTAADLLKSDHPLNRAFVRWCGEKTVSKRKAREFLATFPNFRGVNI